MTMFLTMAACMYPVLLILFVMLNGQSKPHDGLLFGARLPEYRAKDPAVDGIRRKFKREMRIAALVTAVLPLCFLPISYMSIQLTLWILWIFALMAGLCRPYIRANKALRAWKAEQGESNERERTIFVELKQLGSLRCVRFVRFLPATLVSLAAVVLTIAFQWGEGVVIFTAVSFALMTPLFGGCAVWMDRMRLKVISADSDVNLNYNRALRQQWKRVWLATAWMNTGFVLVYALLLAFGGYEAGMSHLLWGSIVYVAALLLAVLWLMVKNHRLNKTYRDKMDLVGYADDDENWLWGLVYYNPGDFRVGVEKRIGVGTTMNMATPAGKAMAVFLAVVFLGMFVLCGWMIGLEFTPLRLRVDGEVLVAAQLREDYAIDLDAMQGVTLVEELPAMSRTNGTGMETLLKGTFRVKATGERVELFLNPENSVFLNFTAEGTTYYMSCADDTATLALYEQLSE